MLSLSLVVASLVGSVDGFYSLSQTYGGGNLEQCTGGLPFSKSAFDYSSLYPEDCTNNYNLSGTNTSYYVQARCLNTTYMLFSQYVVDLNNNTGCSGAPFYSQEIKLGGCSSTNVSDLVAVGYSTTACLNGPLPAVDTTPAAITTYTYPRETCSNDISSWSLLGLGIAITPGLPGSCISALGYSARLGCNMTDCTVGLYTAADCSGSPVGNMTTDVPLGCTTNSLTNTSSFSSYRQGPPLPSIGPNSSAGATSAIFILLLSIMVATSALFQ